MVKIIKHKIRKAFYEENITGQANAEKCSAKPRARA